LVFDQQLIDSRIPFCFRSGALMPSTLPQNKHRGHRARQLALALALAALLGPSTLHAQDVGSGSVSFSFTQFRGPAYQWNTNPSSNFPIQGLVNGASPSTFDRVVTCSRPDTDPNCRLTLYSEALTGNSVSMRYDRTFTGAGTIFENLVSFTPNAFNNVPLGQDFVLGSLLYQNGAWFGAGDPGGGTIPTFLDFVITTTATSGGTPFNQMFYGTIELVTNNPSPEDCSTLAGQQAQADYLYISSASSIILGGPATNSLRVYDNFCGPTTNVGTTDLVAQFNSLEVKGFENASGGGFVNPSITQELTPPSGTSVVPEPSTYALFATGLVGLFAVRRRRRSAN
jgi:hypothetical protein